MTKSLKEHLIRSIIILCGGVTLLVVGFIFAYILYKGWPVISTSFLVASPKGIPLGSAGGIYPAIIGTLYLGLLVAIISGSSSCLIAIYLHFYCPHNQLKKLLLGSLSALASLPSVLFGLIGYTLLVYQLGIPRSLLAASLTVSVMVLPFITLRLSKLFLDHDPLILQTALALGLSKEYTLIKIIIPSHFFEMLSAILLGMTYGIGAVAPIMYTGVVIHASVPNQLTDPFMSLPYHLYILLSDGLGIDQAYGTAFVLLIIILVINISCNLMALIKKGR